MNDDSTRKADEPIDNFDPLVLREHEPSESAYILPNLKIYHLDGLDLRDYDPLIKEAYAPPESFHPEMSRHYRSEPEGYLPDSKDLCITEGLLGLGTEDWPSMKRFENRLPVDSMPFAITHKQARRYCKIARNLVKESICELQSAPTIRSTLDILKVMLRDVAEHPHEKSVIETYVDLLNRFIDIQLEKSQ